MTNEQLNALIDNDLRPIAEKIRALRERIESTLVRAPQYTEFADDATEIALTRSDAASLPTLTNAKMRDFLYLLGTLNTTLQAANAATIESFCVRSIEVSQ